MMQATVHDGAVIDLAGDIDGSAGEALDRAWEQAAGEGEVTLDFERVGWINSTGIALIVGLLAKAKRAGRPVVARGLTEHYREIFRITRLSDFMQIV